MLMNKEGVSSIAVVDNQQNVVGNISNVDVKVSLTRVRYTLQALLLMPGATRSFSRNQAQLLCLTTPAYISYP